MRPKHNRPRNTTCGPPITATQNATPLAGSLDGHISKMSGTPFTLIDTNSDPDRNGILADPLAAGTYSGAGHNAFTTDFDGAVETGHGEVTIDLREPLRRRIAQRVCARDLD